MGTGSSGSSGGVHLAPLPPQGTGNLLIDVDEEKDEEPLPVLKSIWDCPMINKLAGFDDNGNPFSGWTCGWCPLENDGSSPKPYQTMNATKSLVHVTRVEEYDIMSSVMN